LGEPTNEALPGRIKSGRWLAALLSTLSLVQVFPALACSGPPPPSIEDALRDARVVVLAQVMSTKQHTVGATKGRPVTLEEATFRVIRTFKGSFRPGDLLPTRSLIGPGPCGMSARNSPVWLTEVEKKGAEPVPAKLSGRWVIFGQGHPPFALDMGGRSIPLEAGGEDTLRQLEALRKRGTAQQGAEDSSGRSPRRQ
jgi:hypothetical protein